MKLKIPVEVDLNGIDSIVDEIKRLQTYKLFEGDDMVLVNLDDVAEILINHIEAKRKSEPQKMRGKWVRTVLGSTNGYGTTVMYQCSECECISISKYNYCPKCGADMRGGTG